MAEEEKVFSRPLPKLKPLSSRSSTKDDPDYHHHDIFGGPSLGKNRRVLEQKAAAFDFSRLWPSLPDLNENIMAEIARRRNVTDEFYDDIFKGKSKDATARCIPSSPNLDSLLPRSAKQSAGMESSRAYNEHPLFGEKVKSWRDWIPEDVQSKPASGQSKFKPENQEQTRVGQRAGLENGDDFGSYVIEFDSNV